MVGGAMRRSELGAPSRSGRERDWGRRFFAEVISNRRLFVGALGVVLALLTLGPLATVLVSSFRPDGLPLSPGWTFDNYISVWSDSYSWMLLANSLIFSLGSTVFALLISIMLAWLIERTDVPAAGFLRAAILMPMATPPLLLAIGSRGNLEASVLVARIVSGSRAIMRTPVRGRARQTRQSEIRRCAVERNVIVSGYRQARPAQ
jgi:ABC-type sugar transport system permease subunit